MKQKIIELLTQPGVKSRGMKEKEIIEAICPDNVDLFVTDEDKAKRALTIKEIKKILRDENKDTSSPITKNQKGFYKVRKLSQLPIVGPDNTTTNTLYIGRAGECAVMSELLFHGYNTTFMTVDDGIDLVASKDNMFNYIQVKTTCLGLDRIARVQIKKDSFDRNMVHQVWYVIAIRTGKGAFRFFVFKQTDIQQLMFNKVIPASDSVLSIKIRYDETTGKPFMYDNNHEQDVSFWENRFH